MDKTSEALKELEELNYNLDLTKTATYIKHYYDIKQALTNEQELEKFTRLVVVKSFNFDRFRWVLKHWNVEEQLGVYNYGIDNAYKYTKEEFAFIKEMIVKYGKSI